MSRFVLSKPTLQIDLPWPSRYEWNREATFQAGGDSLLLIKIATGGLNGAEPSPILVLKSDGKVFLDQTTKYFPKKTDFAITRDLGFYDFNNDGYLDLYLNNQGPEEPPGGPFPGEQNAYYTFQPTTQTFTETVLPGNDFSHGSAVGDFNGDGLKDILVNNLGGIERIPSYLLINNASASFTKQSLATSFLNQLGPLTASIEINNDSNDELVTIVDTQIKVWSLSNALNPIQLYSYPLLDIPESGLFELRVADFDGNEQDDLLIVGTGDELKNDLGITIGGKIKAFLYFNFGRSDQSVVNVFKHASETPMVTGGISVDVKDLDGIGGADFELRTYHSDWKGARFTCFTTTTGNVTVVEDIGDISFPKGTYYDFNQDGVLDYVFQNLEKLHIALGSLSSRVDGVAYDLDGPTSAGGIYRLYKATFNREPDTGGLGYWISQADAGSKDAVRMAEDFTWSQEFQDLYNITTTDNYGTGNSVRGLVTGFYENVLGRSPDVGGLDYYTGVIESHEKTVGRVLAEISDSPENYDGTIALIANGIVFDPWIG